MQNIISNTITLISSHSDFSKEIFVTVLGVVIGAILTKHINSRAIRTEARFKMEFELLKEYQTIVQKFCRDIEYLEISLSMVNWETTSLSDRIQALDISLVSFCNRLQQERKFVHRHLSAKTVHRLMDCMGLFHNCLFRFTKAENGSGFPIPVLIDKIDSEQLSTLRNVEREFQKISVLFSESMEDTFSPGLRGRISRRLRSCSMFIAECFAIATDGNSKNK